MELIIFIIIVFAILKPKKKKNNTARPNVPRQQSAPVQARYQQTASQPLRLQQNRPAQAKVQQPKSQPRPQQPMKARAAEKAMSTTEKLEAKALMDDREEMREKQRQRMENKKHYGHLNYAERYFIGDAVPKGKKMVFCPYCNAENLIPVYSSARDYNCYFCREDL